jgi:hypothetical protein
MNQRKGRHEHHHRDPGHVSKPHLPARGEHHTCGIFPQVFFYCLHARGGETPSGIGLADFTFPLLHARGGAPIEMVRQRNLDGGICEGEGVVIVRPKGFP